MNVTKRSIVSIRDYCNDEERLNLGHTCLLLWQDSWYFEA